MVLSLAYVFTTKANAAAYDYILYDNDTGAIIVSEKPLTYGLISAGTSYTLVNDSGNDYTTPIIQSGSTDRRKEFYWRYSGSTANRSQGYIDTFFLIPVKTTEGNINTYDVYKGGWGYSGSISFTCALNVSLAGNIYFLDSISANYTPTGIDSVGDLPPDIGGRKIEDIVDDILNATTSVTTTSNTYVTNITNVYNTYVSGGITLEDAKEQVDNNLDNLKDLAQTPTATLKDAVNVNNALTYGQTVNDTLLQEQNEAFWETRDIGDETSANAQISDQEEIDYLNSLIAETTEKISDLSPSEDFTPEQISTTTEIIEGIWENPIISKIIPLAACFMVICVALGIRYKL